MKKLLTVLLSVGLFGFAAAVTFEAVGDATYDQETPKKEDTKKASKKKSSKKKEETPKKDGGKSS